MMGLAKAVAEGGKFLDRPVTQGSVINVNLEDGPAKLRERIEAQDWKKGTPVYWLNKFKLSQLEDLIDQADQISDLRLIVIDTLSRVRDDEHSESAAEMANVLSPLQDFAAEKNVAVLMVHHSRKLAMAAETVEDLFDSLRGSTAIRGTCRGLWVLAPADNSYRLAVENGWGKHDLRVRFNTAALEWNLLGHWSPLINMDQREQALHFLNKVGSATIDTIAQETAIPKRSLYVVLDRLRADGVIEKTGSRTAAVYQRPIQQIQQLNTLLNSSNPEHTSDTGAIQQKKEIFSSSVNVKSDHTTCAKDDHICDRTPNTYFVESGGEQASNADRESVSAIQQRFNWDSTVELQPGDSVEVYREEKWVKATYIGPSAGHGLISAVTGKVHDSHFVKFKLRRSRVSEGDIRRVE
jgi:hypothetical protein